MAKQIFTFGYEGLALDPFLARLKEVGIETVIDVRANPLSRKRGFSKRGLATALEEFGIAYTHARAMGCPKPVRDRYKRDGDWSAYTRGFLAHLKTQPDGLAELVQTAKASTSCLICFEADFNTCHRTFVARAAAPLGPFRVTHLTDRTMIPDADARSAA
jgi:uncharacterized protein (DUF488 family)